jgi:hypothetical protein
VSGNDLAAGWDRTRGHLARAWVELPPGNDDAIAAYQEYLDHNELGLAMETLADLGRLRAASRPFWLALADAAQEMSLEADAKEYLSRSEGIDGAR